MIAALLDRRPLLVALALGGLAACGFAPLELWLVTIACIAALMLLVERSTTRRAAFARGWAFGVGHFTIGLNWIQHAFDFQDAMPHWLGYLAVVLLSLYLSIYPALACLLARQVATGRWSFAFAFAAAWIATEYLRATMFTGFAWNPLGAVFVPAGSIAMAATLVGTYGLAAIVILAAAALRLAFERDWRSGLVLLPVAALVAWPKPMAIVDNTPTLVRVVQPNIALGEGRDVAAARAGLDKIARLTGAPGAEPRLVFWPEAALNDGYELAYDAYLRRDLGALLGPADVLVTGGTRIEYAEVPRDYGIERRATGATNSVFVLDSGGDIRARYDKAHLVPYGEYLPMRALLEPIGLARLVPGDIDFRPGPGPATVRLPGTPAIGFQLCYEIIFSGQVVDRAARPDLIFNPSNDAWFGAWGPPQHLAQARLRAIEEGLPVVRSTPTGISAVIDASGRVIAALPLDRAGFIQTRLPRSHPPTLFAQGGNALPLALALLLAIVAVAPRVRRR